MEDLFEAYITVEGGDEQVQKRVMSKRMRLAGDCLDIINDPESEAYAELKALVEKHKPAPKSFDVKDAVSFLQLMKGETASRGDYGPGLDKVIALLKAQS